MLTFGLVSLLAQPTTLFQEDTGLGPTLGVNVQTAFPLAPADQDLDRQLGFGAALTLPLNLSGRHLLRPNLEYNEYRVTPSSPSEDATFRTLKLGLDYVIYQEPWVFHGPYILAGVGLQSSKVDEQFPGSQAWDRTRSTLTSLWLGTGFGYQFNPVFALEFRYSVADYAAQKGQPLASPVLTTPVRREGRFLHLALAMRLPIEK